MSRRFGRIPEKIVALLEHSVLNVKSRVVTALPPHADDELRAFTAEKVLEAIFRDWTEHENAEHLSDKDWTDLSSFVQMSAALAGKQLTAQGKPIYEASLSALLEDWLYNWNAEGADGPPSAQARARIQFAK